jgi:hypothetical protein
MFMAVPRGRANIGANGENCNTLGAQHATPAQAAQRPAQQGAQRSHAPDVKTLAKQALERIEARNSARNTERNTAVAVRADRARGKRSG